MGGEHLAGEPSIHSQFTRRASYAALGLARARELFSFAKVIDGQPGCKSPAMANEMRDKGIAIANLAVDADNAGNYKDAIEKYGKATEYLITALKSEKNPVTQKTIRDKCNEYLSRMDQLKKGQEPKAAAAGSGGGKGKEESRSDDEEDEPEPEPLTAAQLAAAEKEMDEDLAKLVGMQSVKDNMKRLCKQLSLDIKRKQEGQKTLDLDTDEREIQEAMNRSIDADDDELLAELDGLMKEELSPSAEQQQLLQQQALIIMHMENIMIIDSMVTFSLLRSMRRGEEEKDLMTLMEVEDALVRLDIEARGHHLKLKEAMNSSIDADDDKLLSELYVFEEELATDLSKVDLGRAVGVPSAPISFYSQAAMNLFGAKKKPQSSAPLGASLAQPPVVPAPLSAHLPAHRIDGGRARSPVPQRRHRRPCSTRRRWPY